MHRNSTSALAVMLAALLAPAACTARDGETRARRRPAAEPASPRPADLVPRTWSLDLGAAPARGAHGMVASDQRLASEIGVAILRRGGNAVDAAVATAFALSVAFPQAGNLGGGGFLVLRTAQREIAALDFRETAPAAASRDMYLDAGGTPTDGSVIGHRASGVPGSVAGLAEVHRRYGSLPWRDLVEPAAHLAETGFTVDAEFARSLARKSKTLARFPASAALFVPGGRPVTAGARFADPDLAATLRRIAERGPDEFYRGRTADLLVAEMRRGGGLITGADLRTYRPRWRAPIELDYRGRHVVSMPPPSSGGLVLGLALEALEGWDLGRLGWHSPGAIHLQVEILRRAFARRNTLLGDPDFVRVPIDRFLGPAAVADLRRSISMDRATPSAGIEVREGQHTTHVSVVDARGGAVAMTTTINLQYGSGVTVTGAGFLLNNEMDDFAVAPGRANEFGLVQGEENAIAPGKRMLSSMSPTIVVNAAGDVELVTGAAGGPTIITAVLQVIVNTIDYHMGIAAAVAAPRFHHQHLPDSIFQERGGFEPDTLRALAARGHELLEMPYPASAPSILRERGGWTGASDPRRAVSPAAIGF